MCLVKQSHEKNVLSPHCGDEHRLGSGISTACDCFAVSFLQDQPLTATSLSLGATQHRVVLPL